MCPVQEPRKDHGDFPAHAPAFGASDVRHLSDKTAMSTTERLFEAPCLVVASRARIATLQGNHHRVVVYLITIAPYLSEEMAAILRRVLVLA